MNKIVKGNDFQFSLQVTTTDADGQTSVLDLSTATDLSVTLVSELRRVPCAYTLTDPGNGTMAVRVEGDRMQIGTYGIEVCGKQNGNDFRCFERSQLGIVRTNAEAHLEPQQLRVTTAIAEAALLGVDVLTTDDGETYLTE